VGVLAELSFGSIVDVGHGGADEEDRGPVNTRASGLQAVSQLDAGEDVSSECTAK